MLNQTRTTQYTLVFLLSLFLAPAVLAQANQFEDQGFYLGGGYGLVTADGDGFDEEDSAPHFFAGYQILPFLGIEGGYYDFGEYGNSAFSADIESYTLALTGRLPVTNTLALFARVGPVWTETDISAGPFSDSQDSEEILVGVGMSFEISRNIDLRLAYDWVDADLEASDLGDVGTGDFDADLNMLSAGIKFEF